MLGNIKHFFSFIFAPIKLWNHTLLAPKMKGSCLNQFHIQEFDTKLFTLNIGEMNAHHLK